MSTQHDIVAELTARGWPAAAAARIAQPQQDAEPNRSLTIRRLAATYGCPWDVVESLNP